MFKRDVVAYYGSEEKVALALGLTRQAVNMWGEYVPQGRAYQLENLTSGKLKVGRNAYRKRANA